MVSTSFPLRLLSAIASAAFVITLVSIPASGQIPSTEYLLFEVTVVESDGSEHPVDPATRLIRGREVQIAFDIVGIRSREEQSPVENASAAFRVVAVVGQSDAEFSGGSYSADFPALVILEPAGRVEVTGSIAFFNTGRWHIRVQVSPVETDFWETIGTFSIAVLGDHSPAWVPHVTLWLVLSTEVSALAVFVVFERRKLSGKGSMSLKNN